MNADQPGSQWTQRILRDDQLLTTIAAGQPPTEANDDPVADLLHAWRGDIASRFDQQQSTTVEHSPRTFPSRPWLAYPPPTTPPHRRRRRVLAGSTVVLAITGGLLLIGSAHADPDSPLWPVAQVVNAEGARTRLAERQATKALAQARAAAAEGRYADAHDHLDTAVAALDAAEPGQHTVQLKADAEALRQLLTPTQSTRTPEQTPTPEASHPQPTVPGNPSPSPPPAAAQPADTNTQPDSPALADTSTTTTTSMTAPPNKPCGACRQPNPRPLPSPEASTKSTDRGDPIAESPPCPARPQSYAQTNS